MRLIQRLSGSLLVKPSLLLSLTAVLSILGSLTVLSGGIWDASSHALKEPELFWTIQHVAVYAGVFMIAGAAILSAALIAKNLLKKQTGPKIVILSSIILVVSGFGDSLSHEIFGVDGLISWSHQPLEFGLVLASLGGFLIIKNYDLPRLKFLEPLSIIATLLSASWLGFNLILLVGSTIQCIPVYEIFSSGCAVL